PVFSIGRRRPSARYWARLPTVFSWTRDPFISFQGAVRLVSWVGAPKQKLIRFKLSQVLIKA
ncbi:hypothetical protein LINPERHAP1_LOCUS18840, partial [Linum perenne]